MVQSVRVSSRTPYCSHLSVKRPMRSLSVGARQSEGTGENAANGIWISPASSTAKSKRSLVFAVGIVSLREGSANWFQPTSCPAGAQSVRFLRTMLKLMKRSPAASGFKSDFDLMAIFALFCGAIFGKATLPLSMISPLRLMLQKSSKSATSLKYWRLVTVKDPADALVVEITTGDAIAFISCIAGFGVRSGKTIPSQTKFPSCGVSPKSPPYAERFVPSAMVCSIP